VPGDDDLGGSGAVDAESGAAPGEGEALDDGGRSAVPGEDEADPAGRPPSGGLAEALSVRRNAARGAAVGLGVAALAYLVRVLELFGPFGGSREFPVLGPEGWFLLLAFVLFASTTLLATAAFTAATAVGLARDLD